jgi:hypothetical protein
MSLQFFSPILLVGSLCIAIPIIIHLILKKKPKHLMFPALRFLQQRKKTNLQKLRIRHLVLLALRVLLILVLCLALARPTWIGAPTVVGSDEPLAVVLLFDTSASMEYNHNGKTRLDHAREIGHKILDQLPERSKVAVFDTGAAEEVPATPGEPVASVPIETQFEEITDARRIVQNLQLQPLSQPVTTVLKAAIRKINKPSSPNYPLLVCIFSDRTGASWSNTTLEEKPNRPMNTVYFDLSAPDLRNVAITSLSLRPVSSPEATPMENLRFGATDREEVQIQAAVQVVGATVDVPILLYQQGKEIDRQRVRAAAAPGQAVTELITFAPMKLPEGGLQGDVRLESTDALAGDNIRYWTLVVPQRQVLILADDVADTVAWRQALETLAPLPLKCDVSRPSECPAVIPPETYQVVCLLNVAKPTSAKAGGELWKTLAQYVSKGGSLLVLPGPACVPSEYASAEALALMPAKFKAVIEVPQPQGTFMQPREENFTHPILDRFRAWERQLTPFKAYKFWDVEVVPEKGRVIVPYQYEDKPALVERKFQPEEKVRGAVLLFTTAMYRRNDRGVKDWNNYFNNWFGQGLAYLTMQYSLGLREERTNFLLTDEVTFWLPQGIRLEEYRLRGPVANTGQVPKSRTGELLDPFHLAEARLQGNYTLSDRGDKAWVRLFSVNLPGKETDLINNRPAKEEMEKLLGEGAVKEWKEGTDIAELIRDRLGAPPSLRLIPWLLVGLLLFFIGENLLANLFYREAASPTEGTR